MNGMKIDKKDLPAFILSAVAIRTRKIHYINIALILQQNKNFKFTCPRFIDQKPTEQTGKGYLSDRSPVTV